MPFGSSVTLTVLVQTVQILPIVYNSIQLLHLHAGLQRYRWFSSLQNHASPNGAASTEEAGSQTIG